MRWPLRIWIVGAVLFVASTAFQWSFCHVIVDTRRCLGHFPDPLFRLVPYDPRWRLVSWNLFVGGTFAIVAAMLAEAAAGGPHRIVRFGVAQAVAGVARGLTMLAVPVCSPRVPTGACAVTAHDIAWLGPIPWHVHASNDLFFSGHITAWILALCVTRGWPRVTRAAIGCFLGVQVLALIGGRGHYTLDMVVAVPVALYAHRVSVRVIALFAQPVRTAASSQPAG